MVLCYAHHPRGGIMQLVQPVFAAWALAAMAVGFWQIPFTVVFPGVAVILLFR